MARSVLPSVFLLVILSRSFNRVAASRQLTEAEEVEEARSEKSIRIMFDDWMLKQSKTYTQSAEMSTRFSIFKANLRRIDEHNSQPSSYKLGLTTFADLTPDEFRSIYLKNKFRQNVRTSQAPTFTYGHVDSLPTEVDWRKEGAVTGVKSQGQCGSCWAFSTIGAVESLNQIKTGNLISLSEQELVDCDVTLNTYGCAGGFMDYGFEYIVQNGGVDTDMDYPYIAAEDFCNSHKETRVAASINAYEQVTINSEKDLQKAVAHQPVSVSIHASSEDFLLYESGIYNTTCGTELDHGVLVVGYGTDQGQEYWLVKNSWGESWGESGYIRLQRNVQAPEGMCGIAMAALYPTKTGNIPGSN
ncbi:hypothetical protein MPTK1_1g01840 [Marchantia polymorpha subsp. ruderalis]|uniref:Cysteine protease n=2 Tax=Marchantia polymorpha TaxID=3197 RepID=A0AAF6AKI2_MARPO|nr:hypothetical protein MARPO_0029s0062 [Marchantia polymorpha]BBM96952.1 hypothetical protein Mp_1g01840 [Marchantia polymorpha subsp. ruderalis]|eukprot:PTQ42530.1 hypothetical protein MARPO_0029s0062 [Marchantia polymorpha]